MVLTAIEAGAELGPPGDGFVAPARRVNFPIEDTGFSILNETGLALFNCSLEWVLGRDCLSTGVEGDFNENGERDPGDLDLMAMGAEDDATFDLNGDGLNNSEDRSIWVKELTNTFFGDADFNGEFNSADFVAVFVPAKYETGEAAGWGEGDWNGDGVFNSGDFVAAFGDGAYEKGPNPGGIMVVPEPASIVLIGIGLMAFVGRCRR